MAPKKSKVKKRFTQPTKSIIERTICSHPMLKRVQKEVPELKKKSVKKYLQRLCNVTMCNVLKNLVLLGVVSQTHLDSILICSTSRIK
jgi:hypothetical protein